MNTSLRQSMAWLHTWCGLWLGWLLFAVFLTGTLGVFHASITRWMQPERLVVTAGTVDNERALAHAQHYLERHAPQSAHWEIEFPANDDAAMHLHWDGQASGGDGEAREVRLDPITGNVLPPARDTLGGQHFVLFHYELHAGMTGVWIVAAATMVMLVAMVSGIITHKRFFKDFFTFRPGKGQRSWLDAHNALGVLTLPFLLMIAYTGLVIWWPNTMPAGIRTYYEGSEAKLFRVLGQAGWLESKALPPAGAPAALVALPTLLADARERLATGAGADSEHRAITSVAVTRPGTSTASVAIAGPYLYDGLAFAARRELHYDGVSGAYLSTKAEDEMLGSGGAAPLVAGSVMRTLHMARFGGYAVKWLYFACGLAGTAMMATGLLLFSAKRANRKAQEFGAASARVYDTIDRLNVAAIGGLAIACAGYLWGNRLLPVALPERHEWEIAVFFAVWLAATAHALASPPARAWPRQLALAGLLCLALPLLNALTTGWHVLRYLAHGDGQSAGLELGALALGALLLWAAARVRRAGCQAMTRSPAKRGGAAAGLGDA
ncbi:PepSY-associated TM helix domain-containing protein [Cupriavidus basilensis]